MLDPKPPSRFDRLPVPPPAPPLPAPGATVTDTPSDEAVTVSLPEYCALSVR